MSPCQAQKELFVFLPVILNANASVKSSRCCTGIDSTDNSGMESNGMPGSMTLSSMLLSMTRCSQGALDSINEAIRLETNVGIDLVEPDSFLK